MQALQRHACYHVFACSDVNDPLAGRLNSLEYVEEEMPGFLAATREWFRFDSFCSVVDPNVLKLDHKLCPTLDPNVINFGRKISNFVLI